MFGSDKHLVGINSNSDLIDQAAIVSEDTRHACTLYWLELHSY